MSLTTFVAIASVTMQPLGHPVISFKAVVWWMSITPA